MTTTPKALIEAKFADPTFTELRISGQFFV